MNIGMCFHRSHPPSFVIEVAERLEGDGVDQLWVIEDCFYTAAISLAASALARTDRLTVGIGILPAVARNPAITAMELATLANLAPGRVVAGIGHGVQEWMAQMGARTPSPLTTLEEVLTVCRRLLAGEEVTFEGREVRMDGVRLDRPPQVPPPVLAGVRGPRSVALAGRAADGLVLAEGVGPGYLRWAIDAAAAQGPFRLSVFSALCVADDAVDAYRIMAPVLADLLAHPNPGLDRHSHIEEMRQVFESRGEDGLIDMPAAWWGEVGAIGTIDDAVDHIESLFDAGADDVALFPASDVDIARHQMGTVARLAGAVRRS